MGACSAQYVCNLYIDVYIQIRHTNIPYIIIVRRRYWTWDWRDGYTPLTGVDNSAGVVSVSDPTLLPKVGLGARWHTINMLCELDASSEYFIARNSSDTGMLYFLPPQQPATAGSSDQQSALDSAFVSVAPHVLSIEAGTSFVTMEGISFAHARGTIITATGPVSNITIRDCTVSNGGGAGINMTGTGILISGTEVFGLAATGVEIRGGHHKSLTRGDNVIRGNYIHSYLLRTHYMYAIDAHSTYHYMYCAEKACSYIRLAE